MTRYFETRSLTPKQLQQLATHFSKTKQPAHGVFVTLSTQGKTRACWGNLFPQHKTLVEETIYATWSALTKEYRYPPIQARELSALKIQVTVVKGLSPLKSIQALNPYRDGLFLRGMGKSAVILPGEAKDATYQVTMAKVKAGIRPHENYQLYKVRTDVYS